MKSFLPLYIAVFSLFLSCKNSERNKIDLSSDGVNSLAETSINSVQQEIYVVNDSLVMAWEKKLWEFTWMSTLKSEKIAVKNVHDDNIIDTIINYSQNKSKVEVYKAKNFDVIKSAYIETPDFLLGEFLHVGSKKLVLEAAVKQGLSEELIKVGNEEGTSVFTFVFDDFQLQSITFEGYVD